VIGPLQPGRPARWVQLLLNENATVDDRTFAASRDLPQLCGPRADLVYAAVGKPGDGCAATGSSRGATVIDVGINRLPATGGKNAGWSATSRFSGSA